ncbi:cytochrome c biogenesis protein CcdA [Anaerotalea alkaliphila]|uniref:Redoxin domain-containing protein n=1 Tax=Anaerotalea alkaliphila TaxID=2662126 RepID=A0A7X5KPL6_9FIRM|nr:cytochrome c biogenesis protein CcdA [Anaerotalea alkaliphila]NDL68327.1 redoxin domain-containing protein [Anaerotalea alkaliphila]
MAESLIASGGIPFFLVFTGGLLSFFSPCVVPLIPIYMGYLAGNAKVVDGEGRISYNRGKVFLYTFLFVLGISFAFFLLGFSFSALGSFFSRNRTVFSRVGGILIILLGLVQMGFLEFKFLERERKFKLPFDPSRMSPLVAVVMGFTFSFAWTPCVGPALTSVLILASSAQTAGLGNLLVLVYTLGFVIPFLVLGIFTTQVLNFLKAKQQVLRFAVKASGVLLVAIGIMTFTGLFNNITSYMNTLGEAPSGAPTREAPEPEAGPDAAAPDGPDAPASIPAFDFTLQDQYGTTHTLSDYKGKVVFLNFWATWCPPCKAEMPHIQSLYEEYGSNGGDVVFLGVGNPKTDRNPGGSDGSVEDITRFLEGNGYTFPTVFDETGEVLGAYQISAFPTTFMIDAEGNVYGYVSGQLTKEMMRNIIEQTRSGR